MKQLTILLFVLFAQNSFAKDVILAPGEARNIRDAKVICSGESVGSQPVAKYCECVEERPLFGSYVSVKLVLKIVSNNGQTIDKPLYSMSSNDSFYLMKVCEKEWLNRFSSACY